MLAGFSSSGCSEVKIKLSDQISSISRVRIQSIDSIQSVASIGKNPAAGLVTSCLSLVALQVANIFGVDLLVWKCTCFILLQGHWWRIWFRPSNFREFGYCNFFLHTSSWIHQGKNYAVIHFTCPLQSSKTSGVAKVTSGDFLFKNWPFLKLSYRDPHIAIQITLNWQYNNILFCFLNYCTSIVCWNHFYLSTVLLECWIM